MNLFQSFKEKNIQRKIAVLLPFLKTTGSVLDFGCGDLSLAHALKKRKSSLSITGVDISDFHAPSKQVKFILYDGNTLPFKDKSFDTVISYFVLHHCDDVEKSFSECVRVARKQIIIIEPVFRFPFEKYLMGSVDWIYNAWKSESIPITFRFYSLSWWQKRSKNLGVSLKKHKIKHLVPFLPIGEEYVFEISK